MRWPWQKEKQPTVTYVYVPPPQGWYIESRTPRHRHNEPTDEQARWMGIQHGSIIRCECGARRRAIKAIGGDHFLWWTIEEGAPQVPPPPFPGDYRCASWEART